MKCPHCHLDSETPSAEQVINILEQNSKRDIYEIGDRNGAPTGWFSVSFMAGKKAPRFRRDTAEAVAAAGIVYREPSCDGWYRRVGV